MSALTTVVVPAFRSLELGATLESLIAEDSAAKFEVIVVLNGATPEVRAIAKTFEANVMLIDSPVNLGVSGAFNLGFSRGSGDYLVEMQDDATAEPGWLDPLIEAVESAPDVAGAGALTLDGHGHVRDPGWIIWRDGTTSHSLIDSSPNPRTYTERRAVDYHGSAGMMFRRDAWESVGGLDDSFYPAYYGDVDFCWRLRMRGWRVLLEPRAVVHHAIGVSADNEFRAFVASRNRDLFLDRHASSIAEHGEFSREPAATAREVARAATCAPGPRPAPADDQELRLLQERTALDLDEIGRREREIAAAFAAHQANAEERPCS